MTWARPALDPELGPLPADMPLVAALELPVWAGGFHGFDALFRHASLPVEARRTRTGWLERILNTGGTR